MDYGESVAIPAIGAKHVCNCIRAGISQRCSFGNPGDQFPQTGMTERQVEAYPTTKPVFFESTKRAFLEKPIDESHREQLRAAGHSQDI